MSTSSSNTPFLIVSKPLSVEYVVGILAPDGETFRPRDIRIEAPLKEKLETNWHQLFAPVCVMPWKPPTLDDRRKFFCCSKEKRFEGDWVVRGAILVRTSTLLDSQSGVRVEILDALVSMWNSNCIPKISSNLSDKEAMEALLIAALSFLSKNVDGIANSTTVKDVDAPAASHNLCCNWSDENVYSADGRLLLSQEEADVFVGSSSPLTISRSLLASRVCELCCIFGEFSTALAVEFSGLPLSFFHTSDILGFGQGGSQRTAAPHRFPGAIESVDNLSTLLRGTKVKRLKDSDVDAEVCLLLKYIPE